MGSVITNRMLKKGVALLLLASLLAIGALVYTMPPTGVRSATSPVSNSPSDQLLYVHGSGAQVQYGDYVSSNTNNGLGAPGGFHGLNTYFSYFIEVPPGQSNLTVQIWDPDFSNDTSTANRDSTSADSNSCYRYELWTPSATQQVSATFGTSTSCNVTVGGNGSDAAWYTLATVATPTSGHWEIRVRGDSSITTGAGFNAFGLRAHDGNAGPGGQEFNMYAPSFVEIGIIDTGGAMRFYDFYPYVTEGCTSQVADFDMDGQYGSFNLKTRGGTTVLSTTTGFSNNSLWAATGVTSWVTNGVASDYGIFHLKSGIIHYPGTFGQQTENYSTQYMMNDLHSFTVVTPTGQPEANTFRIYLPTDNYTSTSPSKPYVTQSLNWNSTIVSKTAILSVTVQVVNPANSIGAITFNASKLVTANVPSTSGVTYNGNAAVSQGSVVSQPAIGGTGNVVWNPGTLNANSTATMSYQLSVHPAAAGTYTVTGTPLLNGTKATFIDETGNSGQSRSTYTFGPLCQLAITATVNPTAVTLSTIQAAAEFGIPWLPIALGVAGLVAVGGAAAVTYKQRRH